MRNLLTNSNKNTNMAEGGTQQRSFTGSISKASGDADERFCEPCTIRGKCIAAVGYCQICEEYLCNNCIGVHKSQKMTRGHTVLDEHVMPKADQISSTSKHLCVEVCKTHHPEILKYYCKAHDEPGCVDCMVLNHTSCKKDRVQDISDGYQATEEFKLIHQKIEKFHKELEIMKDTLEKDMQNLDTIYNNIQHAITSYRICINEYLDQVQKQVTEDAAKMKKGRETEMKIMIAKNESMKSELEDILGRIQNDSDVNVNSIFVNTKQAQQQLITMQRDFNTLETKRHYQQQHFNTFRPSSEIKNLVSAKTPLGILMRKPNINTTASYSEYISVDTRNDKEPCFIKDITLLNPEKMVVIDGNNSAIKLIDLRKSTVLFTYMISAEPCGIAAIGTDKVAVTLPDEAKIQVLNVTSTFTKQRQIHVTKDCRGIAYKDGRFAVSYRNPGRVELLDSLGHLLYAIQLKQGNIDMTHGHNHLTFGQDYDSVIVSDCRTNTVSVVTLEGQILHTYKHDTMKGPEDTVITEDGVLFVGSHENGCIHVVSPDFKASEIIINNDCNVVKPWSITYCDTKHRLYISNHILMTDPRKNFIQVYDLNV